MRRALVGIGLLALALLPLEAAAQIIGTLPFTLQNGTIADANQVMSDFNAIVSAVNGNAASAGANSNITALNGLTTPLVYTSGGSSVYLGGTSGGSANAQTVTSPIPTGFTLTTQFTVIFTAGATNTGPMTLAVNGLAATNVYNAGPTGPAALVGGEVVAGNVVIVNYDGTEFQLIHSYNTAGVPTGAMIDYSGPIVPTGWLLANGSAISRTTYAKLFGAVAYTGVSATTNGTTTITVTNGTQYQIGWYVGGNNVTCNSTITGNASGSITINNAAGASGATTLTIGPYPQGDCATTFNLPNFVGRTAAGVDGSTNITNATCTNSASLGALCGAQNPVLAQSALPNVSPTFTGTQQVWNSSQTFVENDNGLGGCCSGGGGVAAQLGGASTATLTITPAGTISSINGNVTQQGYNNLQPTGLVYKIVKT